MSLTKFCNPEREPLKATNLQWQFMDQLNLALIEKVIDVSLIQKWYADDGNAAGSGEALKVLLSKLKLHGPSFGYFVIKCGLITKAEIISDAKNV